MLAVERSMRLLAPIRRPYLHRPLSSVDADDRSCPTAVIANAIREVFSRVGKVVPDCVEVKDSAPKPSFAAVAAHNAELDDHEPAKTHYGYAAVLPAEPERRRAHQLDLAFRRRDHAPDAVGLQLTLGTSRTKHSVPKTRRYPKVRSGIAMVAIVPCACTIEIAADASPMVNLVMNENVGQIADRKSNQQNCPI